MNGAQYELSGRIGVALPPGEAFVLFTPRGEERWADGWRPLFPAPTEDDAVPGTVFETSAGGEHTIWVVLDREPGRRMRYARVTPGSRAGTVSVELADGGDGRSAVEVTYALTALSPDGDRQLKEFAAGFPDYLKSWESAIALAT
ncbi:MAG TPA: SRPBCC family protein [Jiangellaceae bacterium]